MEETLTAHQEALIEADSIVQADLANSISDPGEVLAQIMEVALFKASFSVGLKLDSFAIIRDICLTAYEYAVDREAKSIGLRK
jgi:hypothetical protein